MDRGFPPNDLFRPVSSEFASTVGSDSCTQEATTVAAAAAAHRYQHVTMEMWRRNWIVFTVLIVFVSVLAIISLALGITAELQPDDQLYGVQSTFYMSLTMVFLFLGAFSVSCLAAWSAMDRWHCHLVRCHHAPDW